MRLGLTTRPDAVCVDERQVEFHPSSEFRILGEKHECLSVAGTCYAHRPQFLADAYRFSPCGVSAHAVKQSYILYTKDVMEKDGIIHLPLYMAMFL